MKIQSLFFVFFVGCQLNALDYDQKDYFKVAFDYVSQEKRSVVVAFEPNKAENSREEMLNAVVDFFRDEKNIAIKEEVDKNYIGFCVHIPETEKIISFEKFNLDEREWNRAPSWIRCYDTDRIESDLQSIQNKENIRFIIFNVPGYARNCLNVELIKRFEQMNIPVLINLDTALWDQIYPKLTGDNKDHLIPKPYRGLKRFLGFCFLGAALLLVYRIIR